MPINHNMARWLFIWVILIILAVVLAPATDLIIWVIATSGAINLMVIEVIYEEVLRKPLHFLVRVIGAMLLVHGVAAIALEALCQICEFNGGQMVLEICRDGHFNVDWLIFNFFSLHYTQFCMV